MYTKSKFADDTEVGGAIASLEGREAMQRDLDIQEHWAMRNQFNKSECLILHLGPHNPVHTWKLWDK